MLLLLSKHSIRSLPVVDFGEGKLVNIITQSAVVHMLAECVGLDWFDSWGNKSLAEVDLPCVKPDNLVKVSCYEFTILDFGTHRFNAVFFSFSLD